MSAIPTRPTGRLTKKIHLQEEMLVIRPPSGGPSTGAASPGQTRVDSARIRSRFSEVRSTTSLPTGDIIAAADPCRIRPVMKTGKFGAAPQIIEATVNTPTAPQNRFRDPMRSANQPEAVIQAAAAIR